MLLFYSYAILYLIINACAFVCNVLIKLFILSAYFDQIVNALVFILTISGIVLCSKFLFLPIVFVRILSKFQSF